MEQYYISNPNSKTGFDEVTKDEFTTLSGNNVTLPYILKVYRKELTINEVPEELQETVQISVDARYKRWGEYNEQEISANELKALIEGVI